MSTADSAESLVSVRVRNVGGIDETTVELPPGVTVLSGRNATNRTSFLRAVMAALGSTDVALKGDADEGSVELTVDGATYARRLHRRDGEVSFEGDPYLDEADVPYADCFAFLLETNEARQAVLSGGNDLREVLLRPIDTDAIERELSERIEERREVETELERVADAADRLETVRSRREELTTKIETKREERERLQADIDSTDAGSLEAPDDERSDLLEELNEVRNELGTARYRLETARESLEAARDEREELREEFEDLEEPSGDRLSELDRRVERLRERRRELDTLVNRLSTVVGFNEEVLEGDDGLRTLLGRETGADADADAGTDGAGAVTDDLLADDTTVCWTCGETVAVDQIEETLDRLRDVASEKRTERREVTGELEELRQEREDIEQRRQRRSDVQRRLRGAESDVENRESRVEQLETEVEDREARLEELEGELEELEAGRDDALLEQHREATDLEFEIGRLTSELEEVEAELGDLESRVRREADLAERREALTEEIESLRTRIETIERDAVESFNDHAAELLDVLEYENLERVWLERRETEVREGRRRVSRGAFDLHVVRRTDDGVVYEDTVGHLSESEREVTGLVFALAGYLVHDVHERVPFVLLDSLEAIDSDRIARLVEHFAEHAPTVIVALLPEDAAALPDEYARVHEI